MSGSPRGGSGRDAGRSGRGRKDLVITISHLAGENIVAGGEDYYLYTVVQLGGRSFCTPLASKPIAASELLPSSPPLPSSAPTVRTQTFTVQFPDPKWQNLQNEGNRVIFYWNGSSSAMPDVEFTVKGQSRKAVDERRRLMQEKSEAIAKLLESSSSSSDDGDDGDDRSNGGCGGDTDADVSDGEAKDEKWTVRKHGKKQRVKNRSADPKSSPSTLDQRQRMPVDPLAEKATTPSSTDIFLGYSRLRLDEAMLRKSTSVRLGIRGPQDEPLLRTHGTLGSLQFSLDVIDADTLVTVQDHNNDEVNDGENEELTVEAYVEAERAAIEKVLAASGSAQGPEGAAAPTGERLRACCTLTEAVFYPLDPVFTSESLERFRADRRAKAEARLARRQETLAQLEKLDATTKAEWWRKRQAKDRERHAREAEKMRDAEAVEGLMHGRGALGRLLTREETLLSVQLRCRTTTSNASSHATMEKEWQRSSVSGCPLNRTADPIQRLTFREQQAFRRQFMSHVAESAAQRRPAVPPDPHALDLARSAAFRWTDLNALLSEEDLLQLEVVVGLTLPPEGLQQNENMVKDEFTSDALAALARCPSRPLCIAAGPLYLRPCNEATAGGGGYEAIVPCYLPGSHRTLANAAHGIRGGDSTIHVVTTTPGTAAAGQELSGLLSGDASDPDLLRDMRETEGEAPPGALSPHSEPNLTTAPAPAPAPAPVPAAAAAAGASHTEDGGSTALEASALNPSFDGSAAPPALDATLRTPPMNANTRAATTSTSAGAFAVVDSQHLQDSTREVQRRPHVQPGAPQVLPCGWLVLTLQLTSDGGFDVQRYLQRAAQQVYRAPAATAPSAMGSGCAPSDFLESSERTASPFSNSARSRGPLPGEDIVLCGAFKGKLVNLASPVTGLGEHGQRNEKGGLEGPGEDDPDRPLELPSAPPGGLVLCPVAIELASRGGLSNANSNGSRGGGGAAAGVTKRQYVVVGLREQRQRAPAAAIGTSGGHSVAAASDASGDEELFTAQSDSAVDGVVPLLPPCVYMVENCGPQLSSLRLDVYEVDSRGTRLQCAGRCYVHFCELPYVGKDVFALHSPSDATNGDATEKNSSAAPPSPASSSSPASGGPVSLVVQWNISAEVQQAHMLQQLRQQSSSRHVELPTVEEANGALSTRERRWRQRRQKHNEDGGNGGSSRAATDAGGGAADNDGSDGLVDATASSYSLPIDQSGQTRPPGGRGLTDFREIKRIHDPAPHPRSVPRQPSTFPSVQQQSMQSTGRVGMSPVLPHLPTSPPPVPPATGRGFTGIADSATPAASTAMPSITISGPPPASQEGSAKPITVYSPAMRGAGSNGGRGGDAPALGPLSLSSIHGDSDVDRDAVRGDSRWSSPRRSSRKVTTSTAACDMPLTMRVTVLSVMNLCRPSNCGGGANRSGTAMAPAETLATIAPYIVVQYENESRDNYSLRRPLVRVRAQPQPHSDHAPATTASQAASDTGGGVVTWDFSTSFDIPPALMAQPYQLLTLEVRDANTRCLFGTGTLSLPTPGAEQVHTRSPTHANAMAHEEDGEHGEVQDGEKGGRKAVSFSADGRTKTHVVPIFHHRPHSSTQGMPSTAKLLSSSSDTTKKKTAANVDRATAWMLDKLAPCVGELTVLTSVGPKRSLLADLFGTPASMRATMAERPVRLFVSVIGGTDLRAPPEMARMPITPYLTVQVEQITQRHQLSQGESTGSSRRRQRQYRSATAPSFAGGNPLWYMDLPPLLCRSTEDSLTFTAFHAEEEGFDIVLGEGRLTVRELVERSLLLRRSSSTTTSVAGRAATETQMMRVQLTRGSTTASTVATEMNGEGGGDRSAPAGFLTVEWFLERTNGVSAEDGDTLIDIEGEDAELDGSDDAAHIMELAIAGAHGLALPPELAADLPSVEVVARIAPESGVFEDMQGEVEEVARVYGSGHKFTADFTGDAAAAAISLSSLSSSGAATNGVRTVVGRLRYASSATSNSSALPALDVQFPPDQVLLFRLLTRREPVKLELYARARHHQMFHEKGPCGGTYGMLEPVLRDAQGEAGGLAPLPASPCAATANNSDHNAGNASPDRHPRDGLWFVGETVLRPSAMDLSAAAEEPMGLTLSLRPRRDPRYRGRDVLRANQNQATAAATVFNSHVGGSGGLGFLTVRAAVYTLGTHDARLRAELQRQGWGYTVQVHIADAADFAYEGNYAVEVKSLGTGESHQTRVVRGLNPVFRSQTFLLSLHRATELVEFRLLRQVGSSSALTPVASANLTLSGPSALPQQAGTAATAAPLLPLTSLTGSQSQQHPPRPVQATWLTLLPMGGAERDPTMRAGDTPKLYVRWRIISVSRGNPSFPSPLGCIGLNDGDENSRDGRAGSFVLPRSGVHAAAKPVTRGDPESVNKPGGHADSRDACHSSHADEQHSYASSATSAILPSRVPQHATRRTLPPLVRRLAVNESGDSGSKESSHHGNRDANEMQEPFTLTVLYGPTGQLVHFIGTAGSNAQDVMRYCGTVAANDDEDSADNDEGERSMAGASDGVRRKPYALEQMILLARSQETSSKLHPLQQPQGTSDDEWTSDAPVTTLVALPRYQPLSNYVSSGAYVEMQLASTRQDSHNRKQTFTPTVHESILPPSPKRRASINSHQLRQETPAMTKTHAVTAVVSSQHRDASVDGHRRLPWLHSPETLHKGNRAVLDRIAQRTVEAMTSDTAVSAADALVATDEGSMDASPNSETKTSGTTTCTCALTLLFTIVESPDVQAILQQIRFDSNSDDVASANGAASHLLRGCHRRRALRGLCRPCRISVPEPAATMLAMGRGGGEGSGSTGASTAQANDRMRRISTMGNDSLARMADGPAGACPTRLVVGVEFILQSTPALLYAFLCGVKDSSGAPLFPSSLEPGSQPTVVAVVELMSGYVPLFVSEGSSGMGAGEAVNHLFPVASTLEEGALLMAQCARRRAQVQQQQPRSPTHREGSGTHGETVCVYRDEAALALRVLWRQDMSAYVPRPLPAGLVGGCYLLRYPAGRLATTTATAVSSSRGNSTAKGTLVRDGRSPSYHVHRADLADRLPRGSSIPLPSTTWRSPYLCEHPSEGDSLAAFTPCCDADVDALLHRLAVGSHVTAEARKDEDRQQALASTAIPPVTAVALLTLFLDALAACKDCVAGSEALQTGIPVADVRASLRVAERTLKEAITLLNGKAHDANDALIRTVHEEADAVREHRTHKGSHATKAAALCLTPQAFSTAHGLRLLSAALTSGVYQHVVWCPSAGAALPAMWLMQSLREQLQRHGDADSISSADVTKDKDAAQALPDLFSIVLAGDHEGNLLPACFPSSLKLSRHGEVAADSDRFRLDALTRGFTPAAATHLSHAVRQLHSRHASKRGARTQLSEVATAAPSSNQASLVRMTHTALSVAAVGLFTASENEPLSIPAMAACVRDYGLLPSSALEPRHDGTARGTLVHGVLYPADAHRAPLYFVPTTASAAAANDLHEPSPLPAPTDLRLLQELATRTLGGGLYQGHSLDPSRRLGPLTSHAHLQAVRDVVQATARGGGRVHVASSKGVAHPEAARDSRCKTQNDRAMANGVTVSVPWKQVCGGFDLPITASRAGGFFYVPAVFHTRLGRVFEEWGELTGIVDKAEAVQVVCASVRHLTEPLERGYGGTAGACAFICGYDPDVYAVEAIMAGIAAYTRGAVVAK